jgi:hypothetical protein
VRVEVLVLMAERVKMSRQLGMILVSNIQVVHERIYLASLAEALLSYNPTRLFHVKALVEVNEYLQCDHAPPVSLSTALHIQFDRDR